MKLHSAAIVITVIAACQGDVAVVTPEEQATIELTVDVLDIALADVSVYQSAAFLAGTPELRQGVGE